MYSFVNKLIQNKFYILHFTFYILLILTFSSCSNSTESNKGNLSGVINLENMEDHSGIVVAVYDLAILDTTIVRINNEYPQIGVHINQHTEFDHRLQPPLYKTTTNASGSFEIKDITTGTYNIVAIKDGWGFKYITDYSIGKGDNSIQNVTLFSQQFFSGVIDQDLVFETDHHYIIEDDTEVRPNNSVIIQPGSIIRINPGVDFTINCSFSAQGEENNMFWVTSNDGFTEPLTIDDEIEIYNSFVLSSVASVPEEVIEWGKWDYANIAYLNNLPNITFNNSLYYKNKIGISSLTQDSTFCKNSIFANNSLIGLNYYNNIQGKIEKNIFLENNTACEVKHRFCGTIENNNFSNNETGCHMWSFHGSILHNDFKYNSVNDIKFVGNNDNIPNQFNVTRNIFSNGFGLYHVTPGSSYGDISQLNINHNNFENSMFFIKYYSSLIDNPINMQFNFFNGFDNLTQIFEKIKDINNQDISYDLIIIEPYETTLIQNAGIKLGNKYLN
ncbi:MAG: carboxypeptidase-like regulatory domain-containing protein [Candidatus Cloacimonetes bacterium]|nr:carboxypeptidase-like regulatory domain-containing protein [Candidatus Cloacimonadota bacterium]